MIQAAPSPQRLNLLKISILIASIFLAGFLCSWDENFTLQDFRAVTQKEFNPQSALDFLYNITQKPHTINSHECDRVAKFILEKVTELQKIAASQGRVLDIITDQPNSKPRVFQNKFTPNKGKCVAEGTNIVVRLAGTKRNDVAFLLSAHFGISSG